MAYGKVLARFRDWNDGNFSRADNSFSDWINTFASSKKSPLSVKSFHFEIQAVLNKNPLRAFQ